MDKNTMLKAVDDFLNEFSQYGKSDIKCPFCGTPLKYEGNDSAYEVRCETPNCTKATFRGI